MSATSGGLSIHMGGELPQRSSRAEPCGLYKAVRRESSVGAPRRSILLTYALHGAILSVGCPVFQIHNY